ncbi:hypothetical protein ASF87_16885 [Microbacterium sp. Leaf161]|uniref:flagellar hook-length control protein FliK n=1 Tax=Microbacterium sp. Leaf161 TaxID=1736281 RepID=UPI0006F62FD2|nr:flagellar hook-length control protein FliK [Microbacterium sp. Leaf161]KQR43463.1 hypothetical protein ASF87_16885 [Microbacterium sp. Leaf161]
MTGVALLAMISGAGAGEADTGGRTSGDSGSLFGDALTAAGQALDGASDSGTAMLAADRPSGPTAEASPAADRTIDPQAAIAAMTHLVAWSAPETAGPSVAAPQVTTPQVTTPQVTTSQVTTSQSTVPGETAPDAVVETVPGTTGTEATPVDPVSGAATTDGMHVVPVAAASPTTSASASISAPASVSAAVVAGGRGDPRSMQGGTLGDVREVDVDAPATPLEPAGGGADPSLSEPVAVAPRPESLPRQSSPAIPSMVGAPVAATVAAPNQQATSDAGDQPQGSQPAPATASTVPVAASLPTATPVSSPDAATTANRAVAAQVAPVVVSIAQRPMGTHQLTMTVNPDSLGPVTVRAHITASGDVQVELSGATDAGRDALRTMLVELRRDLAAVMPHASLSVTHGTSADASGDRGQQAAGDAPTGQGAGDRENRGRPDHRHGIEQAPDLPRTIQTTPSAASGAGLDIFA